MHLSESREITQTYDVVIVCPRCKVGETSALAFDAEYTIKILALFPVQTYYKSGVKCDACKREIYTKQKAEELSAMPPEELDAILNGPEEVSFVYGSWRS